jgi:hypothetical protein
MRPNPFAGTPLDFTIVAQAFSPGSPPPPPSPPSGPDEGPLDPQTQGLMSRA